MKRVSLKLLLVYASLTYIGYMLIKIKLNQSGGLGFNIFKNSDGKPSDSQKTPKPKKDSPKTKDTKKGASENKEGNPQGDTPGGSNDEEKEDPDIAFYPRKEDKEKKDKDSTKSNDPNEKENQEDPEIARYADKKEDEDPPQENEKDMEENPSIDLDFPPAFLKEKTSSFINAQKLLPHSKKQKLLKQPGNAK